MQRRDPLPLQQRQTPARADLLSQPARRQAPVLRPPPVPRLPANPHNSNYWDYGGSSTPMKNAYSGKCLTTDTSFYNVYAASCTSNNDYQRWITTGIPGTNYFKIISYAVGQCLWGVSGSSTLHLGNCSSSNHLDWWSSSS